MIFFFGIRSTLIGYLQLSALACPSCKNTDQLTAYYFSKHFHVFWIPIFPVGKTGAVVCGHCKYNMSVAQMSKEIGIPYLEGMKHMKPKLWQYSGLIAIAAFIALALLIALFGKV